MKRRALISTSLVALCSAGGWSMYDQTKKTIEIEMDGEKKTIQTHEQTVEDLLEDLNIHPAERDILSPERTVKLKDNMKIVWEPAKEIQLTVDEKPKNIWTTADTVKQLLNENNITLNKHDQTKPGLDEEIQPNMQIQIDKAFPVSITDGGKVKDTWSTSTTVADFLKQQGITVGKLDRVNPPMDKKLSADDTVDIVRVEKVTDVVEEPKDFAVVTKKDSSLLKGQEKTIQPGEKGLVSKTYEIFRENGKEVSRTLVGEKVLRESQDQIVAVGTKEMTAQVSRGESTGKEFYVTSTAYTANCTGCSGITATGINLHENPGAKVIAVDPSVIPLGTKVYVEGYGYAVAADTGGAIKGHKIDVLVSSDSQAYNWGRKRVKIRILN